MRVPAIVAAIAFGALIASRTFKAALLRRAHRDVGGFAGYSVLTGMVVLVALSVIVLPGAWVAVWHFFVRAYNGGD